MHRSGTSALSRVLALCGASLPPALCPPAGDNPTGFWEPQRAIDLNTSFLASQGSGIYNPGLLLQPASVTGEAGRRFIAGIRAFLETLTSQVTVIKDPRISVLLPYWAAAAAEAGRAVAAVHIYRNPYEVVRSLSVRQNMSSGHALALWVAYNLAAERDARPLKRIFVSYDDLMGDWKGVMSRCASELNLELTANREARDAVASFLTPALRHHIVPRAESTGCPLAEAAAEHAYALLDRARSVQVDLAAFDAERRFISENFALLAEEATRESWRLDVDLGAALARAEEAIAGLERRVLALDGS
jgi:hypothetical protein